MTLFSKIQDKDRALNGAIDDRRTELLELHFEKSPDERSYLARQYSSYPFHICRPQYVDDALPDLPTLYIQTCSGGLYEGDRLQIRLSAGPGSHAHVTSQASTIVHNTRGGLARQDVFIDASENSYFEFLPDPQVLFSGSRCCLTLTVRKAPNATVLVSDAFLAHDPAGGREVFSSYLGEIRIEESSGRTLALDRVKIDGKLFASAVPGVTGAYAAQGSLVVAGSGVVAEIGDAIAAASSTMADAVVGASMLPNDCGLIIRVLARDGAALRRVMHDCWCVSRKLLKGSNPAPRRK